jgi:DNA primase
LIRNVGRQAFDDVVARAEPLVSILWHQAMGTPVNTPEARAAQEEQLMQRVGQIKHPMVQHYYKQYVRDRLREVQQANYQKRPFQPQQRGAFKPGARTNNYHDMPLPPIARTADTSLLAPASNLLALAIAAPSLLQNSSAEEIWLHAPMPAQWQQVMHHLITELHIDSPQLTSEGLWQTLREESPVESFNAIAKAMETLGIEIDKDEIQRESRAQRLWGEVVNDVDRARLRAECAEAESALAGEMNEENFNRLTALKGQLEAIDRERSRFYREDPLSGAI